MATPDGVAAEEPENMQLLVARYRDDAFRLARHLVRSQAEAEDLAHTAILSVLRRADNISDAAHVAPISSRRSETRGAINCDRGVEDASSVPTSPRTSRRPTLRLTNRSSPSWTSRSLAPRSSRCRRRARRSSDCAISKGSASPSSRSALGSRRSRLVSALIAREELVGACMDRAAQAGVGDCRPIRLRLGRYHRGLLSKKARTDLEFHLASCEACASCYEQLIDLYGHRINRSRNGEESQ